MSILLRSAILARWFASVVLVFLGAGLLSPASAEILDPGAEPPWVVESPGGVGSPWGLGLDSLFERQGNLDIRSIRSVVTVRDLAHDTVSTTILDSDPALLQRKFDVEVRSSGPGVQLPLALPSFHLTEGVRIYPSLILQIAAADTTVDFHDKPEPANSDSLDGRGPMVGVGLDLLAPLCRGCRWFGGVGYRFRSQPSTAADRSPRFDPPGFEVQKDSVRLSRTGQDLSARLGYTFPGNRVSSYVGIRRRTTTLDIKDEVSFASALTRQETTLSSRSKLASQGTETVLGLDAHLWGPVFGRAEFAFGDREKGGLLKLVYVRPPGGWGGAGFKDLPREPGQRLDAIADRIAPSFPGIRAEFEARWKALSILEGPGGVRLYKSREVDDLLRWLQDKILRVFHPHPELEALGDWVTDQIAQARIDVTRVNSNSPARFSANDGEQVARAVFPNPGMSTLSLGIRLARTEETVVVERVDVIIRKAEDRPLGAIEKLAREHDLKIQLTFTTDFGAGAKLVIHPRFRDPKNEAGFSIVFGPDSPQTIVRGSYSFEVAKEKGGGLICDARKPGVDSAPPCPLDLVSNPCSILKCSGVSCSYGGCL